MEDIPGDGWRGGETWGFDADQLDDPRELAVRFNHKIGNSFTGRRHQFRAQAAVSKLQIAFLDFGNHVLDVFGKLRHGYAIALIILLAVDIFGGWSQKWSPERVLVKCKPSERPSVWGKG